MYFPLLRDDLYEEVTVFTVGPRFYMKIFFCFSSLLLSLVSLFCFVLVLILLTFLFDQEKKKKTRFDNGSINRDLSVNEKVPLHKGTLY